MEIIDALRDKLNLDHRRNMTCLDDVAKALTDMQNMSTAYVDGNVHGPVKTLGLLSNSKVSPTM